MTQTLQAEPDEKTRFFEFYKADSTITLVAFGGLGHQIGQPIFEFRRSLQPLNVNLVLVRDLTRGWYHHPIEGFGDDIVQKAARLQDILSGIGSGRVLFLGSSAGGFAALMFAGLVQGVADCLLFGPQVFIDRHTRTTLNDHRWPRLINAIKAKKYRNIKDVAGSLPPRVRIIAGSANLTDITHALYARSAAEVDVHILTRGGHNPAKELRNGGVLSDILKEFRDGGTLTDRQGFKIGQRRAALRKL